MRCSCCSAHKVATFIILLFSNFSYLDSPASLSPSARYAVFSFTWSLMTESKLLQSRLQSMWNGQAADVQCPQNTLYKFAVRCIICVFKRVLQEAINSSSENLDRLHSLRIDKLIHYSSWFIHPSIFFSQLRLTRGWDPIPAPMGRGVRLPVYHRTSRDRPFALPLTSSSWSSIHDYKQTSFTCWSFQRHFPKFHLHRPMHSKISTLSCATYWDCCQSRDCSENN